MNLKQEVEELCQQLTALQQAHHNLAAATPLDQDTVQSPSVPRASPKIGFHFSGREFFKYETIFLGLDPLLVSFVTGQAAEWARTMPSPNFTYQLRVDSRFYHLQQWGHPASHYTDKFCILAVKKTWSNSALYTAFYEGLASPRSPEVSLSHPATGESHFSSLQTLCGTISSLD